MKGIAGFLFGAIALAVVGFVLLALGRLDRDRALTERDVTVLNYEGADVPLERAERYFGYASYLPGVGKDALNQVRAERAALRYWQRDYGTIVPVQNSPVTAVPSDNVDLQFVVANAVFRVGQARAKDKNATLVAVDSGINAYLVVLKNAKTHEAAAYNLEYLVRLRDDVERGRRKPGFPPLVATGPLGALGFPAADLEDAKSFRVVVPLDNEDRNKVGNAGKAFPKPRKG